MDIERTVAGHSAWPGTWPGAGCAALAAGIPAPVEMLARAV